MKIRFFTPVVALLAVVLTLASCGSTRSYPEERYPQRYPYPDSRYPDSRYPDRYPDSRYSEYGTRYPRHLPPGHAKRAYGGRSARPYAPGQQKKYDRKYQDQRSYEQQKRSENQRSYEEQKRIEAKAEQEKKDYYLDKIFKNRKKN